MSKMCENEHAKVRKMSEDGCRGGETRTNADMHRHVNVTGSEHMQAEAHQNDGQICKDECRRVETN